MPRLRNPQHTRKAVLHAAYAKMLRHGFQAAGLNGILKETGVTKGALYHHFANKLELGYAVVDEVLKAHIEDWWIDPMEGDGDPIENLARNIQHRIISDGKTIVTIGCPLNTLALEMAGADNGFRQRLEAIYRLWRKSLAKALSRGQIKGYVNNGFNADEAAAFIVSSIQGALSQAKTAQSLDVFNECMGGLSYYLMSLRA